MALYKESIKQQIKKDAFNFRTKFRKDLTIAISYTQGDVNDIDKIKLFTPSSILKSYIDNMSQPDKEGFITKVSNILDALGKTPPQEKTTADVKAKKADIERRRQEELKRFEGRRANSVVKFNPNGENIELTEKEIEEVENLINTAKEKGLSVDRTQKLLQTNGFVQSVGNTATAFREFLSARLSGEIDNRVNGEFLNTINALCHKRTSVPPYARLRSSCMDCLFLEKRGATFFIICQTIFHHRNL